MSINTEYNFEYNKMTKKNICDQSLLNYWWIKIII